MHEQSDSEASVVSNRTMNIVVAAVMMTVAAIVMVSAYRLGSGWSDDIGPDSGYFPFYVALILFFVSAVTLVQNLLSGRASPGSFVAPSELVMVLQVLIPMTIFVILSLYIGIYIATFLFITFFMVWHGRYALYKTIPIAIAVPVALFVIFEIWFLVPLPKGPIEAWLGY